MKAPSTRLVTAGRGRISDGETVHLINPLHVLAGRLVSDWLPRTMCDRIGIAVPGPAELLPLCLECVDSDRWIRRDENGERIKARLSRVVEWFGLDPIRPAGSWCDLADYAIANARLNSLMTGLGQAVNQAADVQGLTGRRRARFARTLDVPAEVIQAATTVRDAGRRLSWWQERSLNAYYTWSVR